MRSRLPCRRSVARTPCGDAKGLAGGRQGGRAVLAAHAERRAGGALWRGRARSQAAGAGEALRPAGGPQSRASREPPGTCRGPSGGRPVGRGAPPSSSEERRVGKRVSVSVDLGGRRNIKKKKKTKKK